MSPPFATDCVWLQWAGDGLCNGGKSTKDWRVSMLTTIVFNRSYVPREEKEILQRRQQTMTQFQNIAIGVSKPNPGPQYPHEYL